MTSEFARLRIHGWERRPISVEAMLWYRIKNNNCRMLCMSAQVILLCVSAELGWVLSSQLGYTAPPLGSFYRPAAMEVSMVMTAFAF